MRAFRHGSAAPAGKQYESYEALEFWGDKILGYVLSQALRRHMSHTESSYRFSQAFGMLGSGDTLGEIGEELKLFSFIEFGPEFKGKMTSELRHRALADVYEAVVTAIHDDQGFSSAEQFVHRTLVPRIRAVLAMPDLDNAKNRLCRKLRCPRQCKISYRLLARKPAHEPESYVCGVFHRDALLAQASGRTQTLAELKAAEAAILVLANTSPLHLVHGGARR